MNPYTAQQKRRITFPFPYTEKVNLTVMALALLLIPSSYFFTASIWLLSAGMSILMVTVLYHLYHFNKLKEDLIKTEKALDKMADKSAQGEILLKEIHHRVKNNLQTVSSLLSMQSRGIDDENTRELLINSQHRVISMALIHEMLYAFDDISRIQYQQYSEQLCSQLVRSVKGPDNNITLNIQMSDLKLGVNTAVPLGLLINEFITNSLKHGILGDDEGEISISLDKDPEDNYLLQLRDDGIGFSETTLTTKPNSLGLRLINNLVRQLRGQFIKEDTTTGVHFKVYFRETGAFKKKVPQTREEAVTF